MDPGGRLSKRVKSSRCRNLLLASLGDDEFERLKGDLERIEVVLGDTLLEQYERSPWAYFPEEAVMSMIRVLEDGSMIEVGVIGFEGLVGTHLIPESAEQPFEVTVQNPGSVWRMPLHRLREEFRRSGEFQEILIGYLTRFLLQVSQSAACNRLHTLERRLARWLLTMRDRTTSDELKLTQEFLSHMLGTRIAGVNEALRALTLSGLVRHNRGTIEILDREGLELAACECYAFVKNLT
jgi:CRP-like cAMP-binding protein